MPNTPANLMAGGTIRTSRFVKFNVSDDFQVLEADANARIFGISQDGTNYPPLDDLSVSANAAIDGQFIQLFGEGDTCLLELGDTAVRGDRLKSKADGTGEPIASSGTTIQQYGAVALQSGVVGELIRVQAFCERSIRPALT